MSVNVCKEDVLELIENSGLQGSFVSYEVIRASDKPIGYMSDHYILKVKTSEESRKFFLKVVPSDVE